jgi:prolyl oligopeptidase
MNRLRALGAVAVSVSIAMTTCSRSNTSSPPPHEIVRTSARPPASDVKPVTETLHGVPLTDTYRWLEGDNSDERDQGKVTPAVAQWTDAQNAYTREVLDTLPGRAALEARLKPLMEIGSVSAPDVRGNRYFFSKREGNQNQALVYWREGAWGADTLLIDPAAIDGSGLTTVEWYSPSPDGSLMAYGTYRAGDENTTLHLMEVASRKLLPLEIPNKTQAPDWMPDGSGFVYQNLKHAQDPYSGQVLFHRMGTDPGQDVLLFRQYTKSENEKLATTWGPFGSLSRDGRWLLLGYWVDTASNDLWLVDFQKFLSTGVVDKVEVSVGETGQAFGTVIDGTLYLQTTKGAPKGRIVAAPTARPGSAGWKTLVAERPDAVVESASFAKGRVAVSYLEKASNSVEVFDLTGASMGRVTLPGIGAAGVSTEEDRTEAYLTFTSFNYPTSIFQIDVAAPATPGKLWAQPSVPVDPASVEVKQVFYPSKDGTQISMFVVHKKGLTKNGNSPTILNGYGGFNVSETPVFTATLFQWFEDGGVFALPNLRGGGEYGDAWHEAGMLDRKQNVFDDFIAAADWLIGAGYTDSTRLAVTGGSNGGLLTGALVTQRPDLVRAAIVAVPLLDMVRYHRFSMARYWVPEYGSADDPEQFAFLHAYSPYHRVKANTEYPGVFLTAGEHDTRVHAMHARKMTALLQGATTASPADRPVLLWVDRDAGHGQGKPLNLRLRDAVDQRILLMWQIGKL